MSEKKHTILIVEPSKTMRKIMKKFLSELENIQIIDAENGTKALSILKKHKIDILLTEYDLPIINGLSLLRKIRENRKIKNIPVIIVSSESSKKTILTALKEGANYYIVKPFNREIIIDKIKNYIDNK